MGMRKSAYAVASVGRLPVQHSSRKSISDAADAATDHLCCTPGEQSRAIVSQRTACLISSI